MRSRHRIVEIESHQHHGPLRIDHGQGDESPRTEACRDEVPSDGGRSDEVRSDEAEIVVDDVFLLDETTVPRPTFPDLARHAIPKQSTHDRPSALPGERPTTTRPSLPWGLGTNGWPRHNSRLVRLFACDPSVFVVGAAGRNWRELRLDDHVEVITGERSDGGDWPQAIAGELCMPYLSLPLAVELRCQPFHARYTRVDIVVVSHCRWPRRFFDVASQCLTAMQSLERTITGAA